MIIHRFLSPKIARWLAVPLLLASVSTLAANTVLRVGYFPNVTHAQGVIGAHAQDEQKAWFEKHMGGDVTIQWYPFNAGPSAMEAVFAGTIDLTYVGPNPALNAYIRSKGTEIRILSGSAEGGAALVVQGDGKISGPENFKGKILATPQLGNTQDVAARAWLKKHGYHLTLTGGDVKVLPTANPDQLALFQQGRIDAVWTVEPWVSRLVIEAGGKVLLEQKDAVVTILVARAEALKTKSETIAKFVQAHKELTAWLAANPVEARSTLRAALSNAVKRQLSSEIIESSWKRLHFTDKVTRDQFESLVSDAQSVGFLRDAIPLDSLFSQKP